MLVSTVAASWLLLAPARAITVLHDALFTAGYAMNYRLAAQGTDYLQSLALPSPLQHYWSLAVEEQFYVVWPLLLLIFSAVALRRRHALLNVLLVIVAAVSLLLCVRLTNDSLPWAYFSIHTRAWELALGALVAVNVAALVRLPKGVAAAITWAGLGAIVASALTFTSATVFPGVAALLPVLGSTAVIAGGCAHPRLGAERLLRHRAAQQIGLLSYGWYLWHWPLLILVEAKVGHELSVWANLGLLAAALLASRISYVLVEEPVRKLTFLSDRPARGIRLGLGLSTAAVAIALAAIVTLPSSVGSGRAVVVALGPGDEAQQTVQRAVTASLRSGAVPRNLTPTLKHAARDMPRSNFDGCWVGVPALAPSPKACLYGDLRAKTTIVLYGDSHADQWLPALNALGKRQRWKILSLTKASCPPGYDRIYNVGLKRTYTECDAWRRAAVRRMAAARPDLVVMSSAVSTGGRRVTDGDWAASTSSAVSDLRRQGVPTLFISDTPRTKNTGPICVADHLDDPTQCALNRGIAYYFPKRRAAVMSAARAAGASIVDVDPWFCSSQQCRPSSATTSSTATAPTSPAATRHGWHRCCASRCSRRCATCRPDARHRPAATRCRSSGRRSRCTAPRRHTTARHPCRST